MKRMNCSSTTCVIMPNRAWKTTWSDLGRENGMRRRQSGRERPNHLVKFARDEPGQPIDVMIG